jgi:hypothetical protein
MGFSKPGVWTIERLALLISMHDKAPKVIYDAVNALPGPAITRNSIIGRRDRLHGMERRPKETVEQIAARLLAAREKDNAQRRDKRAAEKEKSLGTSVALVSRRRTINPAAYACVDAADLIPLRKKLQELEPFDCRWPLNATAEEKTDDSVSHRFCGHPVLDGPYCFAHRRLATKQIEFRKIAA